MSDDLPSKSAPKAPKAPEPTPSVDNPDLVPPPGAIDSDPVVDGSAAGTPAPPATVVDAGDRGPVEPEFPRKLSRAGTTGAVVALGTGLLGAAVVVSATRSRWTEDGDIDWSNFGIGLGATAVLLVVAVLAALVARRHSGGRAREEAVTWPGTVGILATAVMIGVGIDSSDDWVGYLIGAVVVALSVVGYLAARRAAFVVTAIVGLALIYLLVFEELFVDSIGEESTAVFVAAGVTAFVVLVTLLGWLLPTRAVSGVAVGSAGLLGLVGVMGAMLVMRLLGDFIGGMFMLGSGGFDDSGEVMGGGGLGADSGFSESDVWWVLVLAAVLTLLWALAAAVTNHSGFSVLAIALPTILVPMATVALAAEHPSYWSAALAAGGGVLLLGGVLLSRLRSRRLEPMLPAERRG